MGFFSQECHGCHLSILAPYGLTQANAWMNDVIAVQKDGTLHSGGYDGYGRILLADSLDQRSEADWDEIETDEYSDKARSIGNTWGDDGESTGDGPTAWHKACWVAAGGPRKWLGESPHAADQGYFFEPEDYARKRPPKSPAGLARLAKAAERLAERRQRALDREMARWAGKFGQPVSAPQDGAP